MLLNSYVFNFPGYSIFSFPIFPARRTFSVAHAPEQFSGNRSAKNIETTDLTSLLLFQFFHNRVSIIVQLLPASFSLFSNAPVLFGGVSGNFGPPLNLRMYSQRFLGATRAPWTLQMPWTPWKTTRSPIRCRPCVLTRWFRPSLLDVFVSLKCVLEIHIVYIHWSVVCHTRPMCITRGAIF